MWASPGGQVKGLNALKSDFGAKEVTPCVSQNVERVKVDQSNGRFENVEAGGCLGRHGRKVGIVS